jgi:hypothetical protein
MPWSVTTSAVRASSPARRRGLSQRGRLKTRSMCAKCGAAASAIVVARAIRQAGTLKRPRLVPALGFDERFDAIAALARWK